jgi:Domain of unknown function (DUF4190)
MAQRSSTTSRPSEARLPARVAGLSHLRRRLHLHPPKPHGSIHFDLQHQILTTAAPIHPDNADPVSFTLPIWLPAARLDMGPLRGPVLGRFQPTRRSRVIDALCNLGHHRHVTAWQPPHRPENPAAQARDPALVAMSARPGQPPAQPAAAYDPYSKRPTTNGLAITSLICAFFFPPLAVIFGHLALYQIKHSAQQGRGIAVAGLVLGYLFTVLAAVAACVIYLVFRFLDGLYWPV